MLDREEVLTKAVMDCYREMYAKAQPSADWDKLVQDKKDGKIDEEKDGAVYNRHYLSFDEYIYIQNKYLDAYKIKSEWNDDIGILEEYLNEGGSKDKYIEEYTDENGDYHPSHRGYEKVPPLKEQILAIMKDFDCSEVAANVGEQIYDKVMETISLCKDFYRFNMDERKFRNTIAFGSTPTSNAETVKKWWKEHEGIDIEIKERNPLLFWEYDYYGDEIDEVMKDEYGEDWEQQWWDKYKKEQEEKENKHGV